MSEKWQQWDVDPIPESRYNIKRVKGELSEMESTKQLVKLISEIYKPDMKVLDVCLLCIHFILLTCDFWPKVIDLIHSIRINFVKCFEIYQVL